MEKQRERERRTRTRTRGRRRGKGGAYDNTEAMDGLVRQPSSISPPMQGGARQHQSEHLKDDGKMAPYPMRLVGGMTGGFFGFLFGWVGARKLEKRKEKKREKKGCDTHRRCEPGSHGRGRRWSTWARTRRCLGSRTGRRGEPMESAGYRWSPARSIGRTVGGPEMKRV